MTRKEAIELLNQYNLYSPTKQIDEALDMAIEALQAEAEQGEWIRVGHDIYECSICHQNVMTKDIDCYSYCHRCGAKMQNGYKSVGQAWNTDQGRW